VLKLGYKASAEQFAPSKLLAFSVLAEQVGFDSVFVSDHFQPWNHTGGHAPNALVWLGALGASTQRVVMGTSVLTPTFRCTRRRNRRGTERGAVHGPGLA
jgi:coenzyme F420-dependent glucose-6-phosphate dehydrogenase